jgi:hypothetical protein
VRTLALLMPRPKLKAQVLTDARLCVRRLPPELVGVAKRRRDVSVGKLDGNRQNRIESSYGANILKVFIRAMPIVFETHHPDLLEAEEAAIAAAASVSRVAADPQPRL